MSYLEELIKKNEEIFRNTDRFDEVDNLKRYISNYFNISVFSNLFDIPYFISYVGSDARFENLSSVHEGILVIDYDEYKKKDEGINEIVNEILKKKSEDYYKNKILLKGKNILYSEIRFQKDPEYFINIVNNKKYIFASRAIDAKLFYGDNLLFREYKLHFYYNLTKNLEILKDIIKKNKEYKKIIKRGYNIFHKQKITHFDLDKGYIFLDDNSVLGVKIGFLRFIQSYVNKHIIDLLQKNSIKIEDFVVMESDMINKVNILRKKHKIDENKLDKLINAYDFLLELHHSIKKEYLANHKIKQNLSEIHNMEKQDKIQNNDIIKYELNKEELEKIRFYKHFLINEL